MKVAKMLLILSYMSNVSSKLRVSINISSLAKSKPTRSVRDRSAKNAYML